MPRMSRIAALAAAALALTAAPAAADDYAATARNIIPSGQYGSVPPPPGADSQALMYDALTPLFDQVTAPTCRRSSSPSASGSTRTGRAWPRAVPRAGVTIVRDRFNVPHITGGSRDDVTWAMGYLLAEDRGLLLAQARNAARLAAIDAPNINAFGLVVDLKQYTPTKQVDAMILNGAAALRSAGAPGKAVLHDIDVYLQGMNARLGPAAQKWSRVDIFSANAIIGQIFGQGGGDEARRSDFLSSLRKRYGKTKGTRIFDDVSEFDDPDAPSTMSKAFPYGKANGEDKGNAVLDAGSFKPTGLKGLAAAASAHPRWASNFLLVSGKRSTTGHPLFVGGPQIGYTYPGLTLEADISWPGRARPAARPLRASPATS